jgi:hypothetical protein
MVANRRRNNSRQSRRASSRRKPRRAISRKLQLVAQNTPVRCNMPNDPPTLTSSITTSHIIPYRLVSGPVDAVTHPKLGETGLITVKTDKNVLVPNPLYIHVDLLHKGVCGRFGFTQSANAEYALAKVQYWGPTAAQLEGKEATPILTVDTQTASGGITVTDIGTQLHRAKLGVSLPLLRWYHSSSTEHLATISIDQTSWDTGKEAGVLYLSVQRKSFRRLAVVFK